MNPPTYIAIITTLTIAVGSYLSLRSGPWMKIDWYFAISVGVIGYGAALLTAMA